MFPRLFLLLGAAVMIHSLAFSADEPIFKDVKVKLGNEVLFEDANYTKLLQGKRLGLVTNPSGMDSRFVSTIDKLAAGKDWKLAGLFGPEHGIRGDATAGEKVKSGVDPVTSIPIHSLYGSADKPLSEIIADMDMLVYDIQDIGNRSYTYVGTMQQVMRAAAKAGKEFMVLDRPNPMSGNLVSGNILDPKFESMVGWAPVAYLYGLTPGETAMWLNENQKINCKLHVVPMKGWTRSMKWWDTGLPWIPASTHLPTAETCWHIAITGTVGEMHTVNEGVGYPGPFQYAGAPGIDGIRLAKELNSRELPGVYFRPAYWKPYYGTHKEQLCGGVQIFITDYDEIQPVETGTHLIDAINKLYPEKKILGDGSGSGRANMFDKVMGTDEVRKAIQSGKSAAEINASWKPARDRFAQERAKYFLYK